MERLLDATMSGEILYSFVIIACSLMIYFATKELYLLSSHKGIKYFRLSFLFFALAYFFRSFIKITLLSLETKDLLSVIPIFASTTFFAFMYFSSMAIFYLLYSVIYKKWKSSSAIYILHAASLIIATTITLCKNQTAYLIINALIFVLIALTVYISYKQSKKKQHLNLYIIYLLLFVFWTLNIINTLIPKFLQTFQLFIYLASLGIFLSILYKVIKKTN